MEWQFYPEYCPRRQICGCNHERKTQKIVHNKTYATIAKLFFRVAHMVKRRYGQTFTLCAVCVITIKNKY